MVTGATGLVGSAVTRLLLSLNEKWSGDIEIITVCRNKEKILTLFPKSIENCEIVIWDAEKDALSYDKKADYVIHCSGSSGGSKMHLINPEIIFDNIVIGTRRVLDWCAVSGAAFLFVSSYEVYGEVSQKEPFNENMPCHLDTFVLRNIYAECRRMCESLCCAYSSKYGVNTYSVRLTSTFGEGAAYNDPRFFAEFARCVIENRDIVLKSTGSTVRSYLDIDDAATAMLFVLVNGRTCNAYNLTNMQNEISVRDLAQLMINVSNSKIKLLYDIENDYAKLGFRKEGCTLMDSKKLMSLGWNPVFELDETIRKLINSMKKSWIDSH